MTSTATEIETKVKERPILFRGDLVRKILAGTKTQTRRPVKGQFAKFAAYGPPSRLRIRKALTVEIDPLLCPFGQPGDLLYVKEKARLRSVGTAERQLDLCYAADDRVSEPLFPPSQKPYRFTRWTPSIHMPKWAARIWLEITDVRAERIEDINVADLEREGCVQFPDNVENVRNRFSKSWNATYPGSWDRNDWVWVISFKKVQP